MQLTVPVRVAPLLRLHVVMRMERRPAVTEPPPITRQYGRFVGEFMVSLAFARCPDDLDKSLT
jgi:hypothetical protein